jgi:hypothetical protein
VDWIQLAQIRVSCGALANAIMNFLTTCDRYISSRVNSIKDITEDNYRNKTKYISKVFSIKILYFSASALTSLRILEIILY